MQKLEEQINTKQALKEKREKEIEIQKEINYKLKNDMKNGLEQNKEDKMRKVIEEAHITKEQKKVYCILNTTYIF